MSSTTRRTRYETGTNTHIILITQRTGSTLLKTSEELIETLEENQVIMLTG